MNNGTIMETDSFVRHSSLLADASRNSPATQVILIRHGLSTFNQQGRMQGSSNESRLTAEGRQAARRVGQWLRGLPIDEIYTSPLQRAHATAEELVRQISRDDRPIPLQVDSRLREVELPEWEGRSFQQIRELFAAEYRCWKQRPHELQMAASSAVESGEPSRESAKPEAMATMAIEPRRFPALDLYDRVTQFWQAVLPRHPGQTLVVVSHNSTNQALLGTAIGLSAAQHHRIQQSNCGVNILRFPQSLFRLAQVSLVNAMPSAATLPPVQEGAGLRLLLLPSEQADGYLGQASVLAGVTIDFCWNCQIGDASLKSDPFLCHHPETICSLVHVAAVSSNWQPPKTDPTQLTTGLIIAPPAYLTAIIGQAIALDPSQYWHLSLVPKTLSVLHYPSTDHPPILQALNWVMG